MGFLDTLLGRTKPVPPNLDKLFGLPGAALTLEAGTDFRPTGTGSVCFRAAEGKAFGDIEKDVRELLTWARTTPPVRSPRTPTGSPGWSAGHARRLEGLVTDLHAVNSSLELGGFGPQLLCTIMAFQRLRRPQARPGLPVQAGHVLPVRAAIRRAPGQRAGTADPRRARRRPEGRAGPEPVDAGLGRARPVSRPPGRAIRPPGQRAARTRGRPECQRRAYGWLVQQVTGPAIGATASRTQE